MGSSKELWNGYEIFKGFGHHRRVAFALKGDCGPWGRAIIVAGQNRSFWW
jgi:hypothetical protein